MTEEHDAGPEQGTEEGPDLVTLETYEKVVAQRDRAEAKAQVMIEAFVKLREIACNFAPVVAMSQDYEPLRRLMSYSEVMEAAIAEALEREG